MPSPSHRKRKKIVYFDCPSGVAGNMTIGALLDAGIDFAWFKKQIGRLPIGGYELVFRKKRWPTKPCKGIESVSGAYFDVEAHHHHSHRPFSEIRDIIRSARFPERVETRSLEIFSELARAEARVHQTTLDRVHFHEVGAVDAIIDIVGTALCLEALSIDEVYGSPVNVGFGKVRAAHGWLDLPAPATREMLEGRSIPYYAGKQRFEMATPTGVAILGSQARSFRHFPRIQGVRHGYGFGSRDFAQVPNALHVVVGDKK